MAVSASRSEDTIGLVVAIVLHALLVAAIALQMLFAPEVRTPPERVTVSLATEVSLQASSPNPAEESRAAIAPTLAEEPAPEADPAPAEDASQPAPALPPVTRSAPTRTASPPDTRDRRRPDPRPSAAPTRSASNSGGSRIGDNFLTGRGDSSNTDQTAAPAPTFGRRERAALASAITRQLRPHWNAPSGVDAQLLVSTVSWRLNEDGSLRGRPTCRTDPASITQSNRPQAGLHCERAIRAVQLAAPFNLPEQFYSRWDDLEWQFDRRL